MSFKSKDRIKNRRKIKYNLFQVKIDDSRGSNNCVLRRNPFVLLRSYKSRKGMICETAFHELISELNISMD